MINVLKRMYIPNKVNNKITELRTILQRESLTKGKLIMMNVLGVENRVITNLNFKIDFTILSY